MNLALFQTFCFFEFSRKQDEAKKARIGSDIENRKVDRGILKSTFLTKTKFVSFFEGSGVDPVVS